MESRTFYTKVTERKKCLGMFKQVEQVSKAGAQAQEWAQARKAKIRVINVESKDEDYGEYIVADGKVTVWFERK